MKPAKSLLSFLIVICAVYMSQAQGVTGPNDYFGSYSGKDNLGQTIQLDLDASFICTFKVNGVVSFNIVSYKLIFQHDASGNIINPDKAEIWLYTSLPNSGMGNPYSAGVVTPAPAPYIIYYGNAILDGNLIDLDISVKGMPVTNPIRPGFIYTMDLHK